MRNLLLSRLTNAELVDSIEKSASKERSISIEILDQLAEMDRRKIHLELGFRSLHSYCVSRLRYSESAAGRRICTARAMAKCAEIREMITDGRLNLSTVCVLSTVLNPSNHLGLLKQASGKSRREVEAIVASLKPRKRLRERIMPITIEESTADRTGRIEPTLFRAGDSGSVGDSSGVEDSDGSEDAGGAAGAENSHNTPANRNSTDKRSEVYLRRGGKIPATLSARIGTAAVRRNRFELRFSVDQDVMAMLERARKVAPGSSNLESVFGRMLREYLDRHDPAGRQARREKRRNRAVKGSKRGAPAEPKAGGMRSAGSGQGTVSSLSPCSEQITGSGQSAGNGQSAGSGQSAGNGQSAGSACRKRATDGKARSRRIPATLRDEILLRDGFRCKFIAPDGTRCDATHHLQIDHIKPFALGGEHEAGNLRLLCGAHNRLEADRMGLGPPVRG